MGDSESPEEAPPSEPGSDTSEAQDAADIHPEGQREDSVSVAPAEDDEEANKDEKEPVKERKSTKKIEPVKGRKSTKKIEPVKGRKSTKNIEPSVEEETLMSVADDPENLTNADNIFGMPRGELGPVVSFSSSESSLEEEEERSSDIISYLAELGLQPGKEPIDRAAYEEELQTLKVAAVPIRRKNGLLMRKIGEYYKKRRMLRVFEDDAIDTYESLLNKYEQKALDLNEFLQRTGREREAITNELKDMKIMRDEQMDELIQSFSAMQDRELEVGHGLIDSRTGKPISDKVIERLLHRQKSKSDDIATIRLYYIKRRDRVKEIDQKIKSLETIDGTLHLMDFEQLRMENQIFSDKIEERDDELMRLRGRYSHAVQALAHIREKLNVIQVQIDELHDRKICEETVVNHIREELNALKIQRDFNRAQRAKLKRDTGILTYPKLLMDMEVEITKIEKLREELENLKLKNKDDRLKLKNIRLTIEKTTYAHERKYNKKLKANTGGNRYMFSRPTIAYPVQAKIALLKSRITDIDLDD